MSDARSEPTSAFDSWLLRLACAVAVILLSAVGWFAYRVQRQKDFIRAVENEQGRVGYDYQLEWNKRGDWNGQPELPAPEWMIDALGIDCFAAVVCVDFFRSNGPISDDLRDRICEFGNLELFGFDHGIQKPGTIDTIRAAYPSARGL